MSNYQQTYTHSIALVIGINTYTHPRLSPLGEAENDAERMAAVLSAAPYNFTVKSLLTGFQRGFWPRVTLIPINVTQRSSLRK